MEVIVYYTRRRDGYITNYDCDYSQWYIKPLLKKSLNWKLFMMLLSY